MFNKPAITIEQPDLMYADYTNLPEEFKWLATAVHSSEARKLGASTWLVSDRYRPLGWWIGRNQGAVRSLLILSHPAGLQMANEVWAENKRNLPQICADIKDFWESRGSRRTSRYAGFAPRAEKVEFHWNTGRRKMACNAEVSLAQQLEVYERLVNAPWKPLGNIVSKELGRCFTDDGTFPLIRYNGGAVFDPAVKVVHPPLR